MILRVCDAAGLLHMVPYLKHQNAHGAHIYIRPAGEHNLSLMDDLNERQLDTLTTSGFEPCAIVETSPGNFQAWLKHPRVLPRRLSTLAARELVTKFGGDIGSADWRHFGRLPGFTNRKPKYEKQGKWPFVLLRSSRGLPYAEGETFLRHVEQLNAAQVEERHKQRFARLSPARCARFSFLSIDRFRSNPKYGGDLHRADMAFATLAKAMGMPDSLIQAAIESRDLSKKRIACAPRRLPPAHAPKGKRFYRATLTLAALQLT